MMEQPGDDQGCLVQVLNLFGSTVGITMCGSKTSGMSVWNDDLRTALSNPVTGVGLWSCACLSSVVSS